MMIRKTMIALTSASALCLATVSAVSAGPPTVHGYLTCEWNGNADYEVSPVQDWARRDIARYRRDMPIMDGCKGGTIEVVPMPA